MGNGFIRRLFDSFDFYHFNIINPRASHYRETRGFCLFYVLLVGLCFLFVIEVGCDGGASCVQFGIHSFAGVFINIVAEHGQCADEGKNGGEQR